MTYLGIQIDYLLFLQHLREITGDIFTPFLNWISCFGQIIIPLWISSLVYWCIDKQAGTFVFLNEGFSVMFTQVLKNIFCIFRPWVLDTRVKPAQIAIYAAGGYSFPSGHTTTGVACYGSMARFWRKNKILMISLILFCLLIAFSRNYLGVHTPQDVIVALIACTLIMFAVEKILKWVDNGENRDILLVVLVSIFGLLGLWYSFTRGYPHPELVDPYTAKMETLPKCGFMFGIFWGWLLERRFVNFNPKIGDLKSKILRFINGGIILYFLTSHSCGYFINIAGHKSGLFLHFFFIGIFVICLYPWFIKVCFKDKETLN